ncbi:hypothetical protein P7C70_g7203, partial [Phenoliferia sp. Uapishka_3]
KRPTNLSTISGINPPYPTKEQRQSPVKQSTATPSFAQDSPPSTRQYKPFRDPFVSSSSKRSNQRIIVNTRPKSTSPERGTTPEDKEEKSASIFQLPKTIPPSRQPSSSENSTPSLLSTGEPSNSEATPSRQTRPTSGYFSDKSTHSSEEENSPKSPTPARAPTPSLQRPIAMSTKAYPKRDVFTFKGEKTREFLSRYETAMRQTGHTSAEDLCKNIGHYCEYEIQERIEQWVEWGKNEWDKVKEKMLKEFVDERKRRYVLGDLDDLVDESIEAGGPRTYEDAIKYHLAFTKISSALITDETISWQEESRLFKEGLGSHVKEELNRKAELARALKRQMATTEAEKADARRIRTLRLADLMELVEEIMEERGRSGRRGAKGGLYGGSRRAAEEDAEDDSNARNERGRKYQDDDEGRKEPRTESPRRGGREEPRRQAERETTSSTDKSRRLLEKSKEVPIEETLEHKFSKLSINLVDTVSKGLAQAVAAVVSTHQPPPHQRTSNSNPSPGQYNTAGYNVQGKPRAAAAPGATRPMVCNLCNEEGHMSWQCKEGDAMVKQGILNIVQNPNGRGSTLQYDGQPLPRRMDLPTGQTALGWVRDLEAKKGEITSPSSNFFEIESNVVEFFAAPTDLRATSNASDGSNRTKPVEIIDMGDFSDEEEWAAYMSKRQREGTDTDVPVKKPRGAATERFLRMQAGMRNEIYGDEGTPKSVPKNVVLEKKREGPEDVRMKEGVAPTIGAKTAGGRTRKAPAYHLKSELEQQASKDEADILEKVLHSPVTTTLRDLLIASPLLATQISRVLAKKKVPIDHNLEVQYSREGVDLTPHGYYDFSTGVLAAEKPLEAHLVQGGSEKQSYSGQLSFLIINIDGHKIRALLDNGSQINVMQPELQAELQAAGAETYLRKDGEYNLRGVNGAAERMRGVCENVEFKIGGQKCEQHFFVPKSSSQQVILGVPFLRWCGAQFSYQEDGSVVFTMRNDNKEVRHLVTQAYSPNTTLVPNESPMARRYRHEQEAMDEEEASYIRNGHHIHLHTFTGTLAEAATKLASDSASEEPASSGNDLGAGTTANLDSRS